MSSDLWRWADPEGQQRTVRLDELRAALAGGHIAPNTPVWKTGWSGWRSAHEVPELTSASLGGANGVVLNIPPPPLAMVAVQQAYESMAPPAPAAGPADEPPPPPRYVPAAAKASIPPTAPAPAPAPAPAQLKTQIGGTPGVPAAKPAAPTQPSRVYTSADPNGKTDRVDARELPTAVGVPSPLGPALAPPMRAEELSASDLLDVASVEAIPDDPSTRPRLNGTLMSPDGLPPPTDPTIEPAGAEVRSPFESMPPPRRAGLTVLLEDFKEIREGRPPKNKARVIAVAGIGLALLVLLIAGIASVVGGSSKTDAKKGTPSATPSSRPPEATAATTAAATAPPSVTAPARHEEPASTSRVLGDCTVTGEEKTIAPRAVITSGIDAQPMNGALALGFASAAREGVATLLDSTTLTPTMTVRTRAIGGDTRHVFPMMVAGKLTAVADVDRKGDRLVGRRTVAGGTLVDIGVADGAIMWAPHGKDSLAKLFAVDGDGSVEALRAYGFTDRKGLALAYRFGNAIHFGAVRGDAILEADGSLSKIVGLGQVGSPAIVASGERIVVAWADRPGAQDDWQIRWTSVKIGGVNEEAVPFAIPEGGLGSQAMSPSLAALGGGRFLLAWTEGPVSNHQVRAITIGADGSPSGAALAISATGVNAGQPSVVVGPDGHGAVAFLAAKGKATEVHATAIHCPPR